MTPGPNALRRGRTSVPHANYFVTVCLQPRRAVLVPGVAAILVGEAQRLAADGGWTLRCLTVLPDHAHVFFTLGERLTLSQAVARLKTKTQTPVRAQGTGWQDNFYDHKVRREDSAKSVHRYIYLNSYRAGLIQPDSAAFLLLRRGLGVVPESDRQRPAVPRMVAMRPAGCG